MGVTFPKTQPVFTEYNRYIDLKTNTSNTPYTLEIPVGNYTITDIINYLNTKYVDLVYCRVIVTTGQFVIASATSVGTVQLLFGSGNNRHRSAHTVLGYPPVDTGFANEQFGIMHVNLDSSRHVDVILEEIPSVSHQETHDGGIAARVPLDNPNFTVKYWENDKFFANTFYPTYIPRITIQLRNADGHPYDTFGFDHVLALLVTYHDAAEQSFTPPALPPFPSPPQTPFMEVVQEEPPKKVLRNAAIGVGVLGGSYFALTRLAKR